MLVDQNINPGERVNIDAASRELEVSQTPLREALARLEAEGLVVKEPLKGYRAAPFLTLDEFRELFQFRELVEVWAAKEAAQLINETYVDIFGKLLSEGMQIRTAPKTKTLSLLHQHEIRFHNEIMIISGNRFIRDAFARSHPAIHIDRCHMAHLTTGRNKPVKIVSAPEHNAYQEPGSPMILLAEHELIVKAIVDGDKKSAGELMAAHIRNTFKRLAPLLENLS